MFIIKDLQFDDKYFGGNIEEAQTFNTLKEVCEQLIAYHSQDCNMEEEEKLLNNGEVEKCLRELCCFEWQVIELKSKTKSPNIKGIYCPFCGTFCKHQETKSKHYWDCPECLFYCKETK